MGGKTSKPKRHCCLECGCFDKSPDTKDVSKALKLKEDRTVIGWTLTDEHRKTILHSLLEWDSEVVINLICDYLNDDCTQLRSFFSSFRQGLFKDNSHSTDVLTPLSQRDWKQSGRIPCDRHRWVPSLHMCADWMKSREMIKVIVLGNGSTGKTWLVTRFISDLPLEEFDPTIEDSLVTSMEMPEGVSVNVGIFDTAGGQEFASLQDYWMRESDVAIICADLSDDRDLNGSFQFYLSRFLRYQDVTSVEGRTDSPKSWSEDQNAAVILVGTKVDKNMDDLRGDVEKVRRVSPLSEEWNVPYIECSAKYNINVDLVFQCAVYECWLKEQYFSKP